MNTQMSSFAQTIMDRTYAHDLKDGGKETWDNIAYRVTKNVLKAVGIDMRQRFAQETHRLISERKLIPAGRYLYASGRQYHQIQNCYKFSTKIVTDQGCKPIGELVGKNVILMTTRGRWAEASVQCFGKQKLYKVVLSFAGCEKIIYATAQHSWRVARKVSQGGPSRGNRAWLQQKTSVDTIDLKKGDILWQVFGYGISRTPISPAGIQHGLVFGDGSLESKKHASCIRLCGLKNKALLRYFPLYPVRTIDKDIQVTGLPSHYKQFPLLNWDRSYLLGWLSGYFAADGCVSKEGKITLSSTSRKNLEFVKDVAYLLGIGGNPIRHIDRVSNLTGKPSRLYTVSFYAPTLTKDFFLITKHKARFEQIKSQRPTTWRVKSVKATKQQESVYCAVVPGTHEFVLEDNILTGNCLLLNAHDSREGWSELLAKASMSLMTGAGIGTSYSDIRHEGSKIRKTGGTASGPISLMQIVNECGRGIMQGGVRRSAIMAGLRWDHPDIHKFIRVKNWSPEVRELKAKDYSFPATLDFTNISVQLNDEFFISYHDDEHDKYALAQSVYWAVIEQMLKTGEPGFSVDVGKNEGEILRNAPLSADTHVLTDTGYQQIRSIVNRPATIWTGKQWAENIVFKKTGSNVQTICVEITGGRMIKADPTHEFLVERWPNRIDRIPAAELKKGDTLSVQLPAPATLVGGLVSVLNTKPGPVEDVFCCNVNCKEHTFIAEGVTVANCGEVSSRDDSDICLAEGTPVLTKKGWKPIEQLTLFDKVAYIDDDGTRRYEKPSFAGRTAQNVSTRTITTSTGAEITVTPNHLISSNGAWIRADQLTLGDTIDTELENDGSCKLKKTKAYDDWFALGWLVGDGWCSQPGSLGVCAGPDDVGIFKKVAQRLEKWSNSRVRYQTQPNGVLLAAVRSISAATQVREKWGLTITKGRDKKIPHSVWSASKSNKAAFLAGLFASDGTVKTNRKNAILSSSSRDIRKGVRLLLAELGIRAWAREFQVKGRKSQGVVVVNGASVYRFAGIIGFGYHTQKNKELRKKLASKYSRLTRKSVQCIQASKKTTSELAAEYNISKSHMRAIRSGRHKGLRLRSTDKIVKIKVGPVVDVYDLTMPTSHSFIADTLKVHNCNLGSINMSRIEDLDEFKHVLEYATAFLLAGTVYSDVPYSEVDRIRSKNRRLGLGLMGIHEWLLKRGKPYAPDEELGTWLAAYAKSGRYANKWADEWELSRPKKTRALAPNGTTSIVAETTGGIEPIFCVAYKRRYLKGDQYYYQYVIDPCAKRLIESGVDPDSIEDAYALARDVEKRVAFQAWVQGYVDHCISSTINLPAYGTELNNQESIRFFGSMLMRYLPRLRGITVYPDGGRSGQPLSPVPYKEALEHEGAELVEEAVDVCSLKGGSCGD